MSLVNDMLRDLDQRRADEAITASGESLKPAQSYTAGSKSRLGFTIGGLAASAAIFSGIWFFGLGTRTSKVDIAISSEAAVSSPALVNKSVSVAGSVEPHLHEVRTITDSSNVSTDNEMQLTAQEILSEPSVLEMPSEPLISDLGESEVDLGEAGTDAPARAEEKAQENAVAISTIVQPATLLDAPQTIRSIDELSANEVDVIQVQSALTLLANGNEEAAFDALSSHVRAAPAAHQSRETLIKLLLSRGQSARAGALADAGLSIAPNHSGFKKAKARFLIVDKYYESAAALLSARAPKPSSDLEYHELLASAQLGAGDFVGAMQSYRQLIQFDGSQARWWYGYAVANDRMGNVSAAKQSYEQALKGASLSVSLRRSSEERVTALAAQ